MRIGPGGPADASGGRLAPPGGAQLLGTDKLGRDLLTQLMIGARIALTAGAGSVLLGGVLGVAAGLAAGFATRRLDDALTAALHALIALPTLLLAMLVMAVREASLGSAVLAIGLAISAVVARLTRILAKRVLAQDHVTAARTSGGSWPRGRAASAVFQEPLTALDPLMRIGRQIAGPLRRRHGLRGAALRAAVLTALEEVRLPERVAGAYPHEFSGGQRQRVAIARAAAQRAARPAGRRAGQRAGRHHPRAPGGVAARTERRQEPDRGDGLARPGRGRRPVRRDRRTRPGADRGAEAERRRAGLARASLHTPARGERATAAPDRRPARRGDALTGAAITWSAPDP
ncbi:ATP-binding cassette domain-containing protein [Nonomuraea sp. NPDC050643]|uniref:ATP-binding cassette domain-containing protein n=1 Tax=Nonomuraea sp. NPDC050643 TaxID=3155660 RepID=UPI0033D76E1A